MTRRLMGMGVLLLMAFCLLAPQVGWPLPPAGSSMPDISLPDSQGDRQGLKLLAQDKVVVLVYWSLSCPHCQREMPHLVQLAKRLSGNPFILLTINGDGQAMAPAVKAFALEQKIPHPILLDEGPDDAMPVAQHYDIVATPTVMVFDRQGKLVSAQELGVDWKKLEDDIAKSF